MRYTTPEAISAALRGRLELITTTAGAPFGSNLGAKQVDLELLEHKGAQIEAWLDSILGMIYELPIPSSAAEALKIVGSMVEDFTISKIIGVHYQGSQVAQLGGEGGYASVLYRQALERLQCYVVGHGIYVAGITPPTPTPFMSPQPIVLPGVPLKTILPDTITRNYMFVSDRASVPASAIQWE